jgi:hypothetical protein
LVIAGSRAQYKGTGTINGSGNYGFLLTAVDGDLGNSISPDLFRVKIWDKKNNDALIYDNQNGAEDNAPLATQLGGGSIVIHTAKNNTTPTTIAGPSPAQMNELAYPGKFNIAYPNPGIRQFTLSISSDKKEVVTIRVSDILGRVVESRLNVSANTSIRFGKNYYPGIYFVEVQQGKERRQLKLIKLSE